MTGALVRLTFALSINSPCHEDSEDVHSVDGKCAGDTSFGPRTTQTKGLPSKEGAVEQPGALWDQAEDLGDGGGRWIESDELHERLCQGAHDGKELANTDIGVHTTIIRRMVGLPFSPTPHMRDCLGC